MMDKKKVIEWITAAVARGIAWLLVGTFGLEAAKSEEWGVQIAGALVGLVIVGISIYSSVKGRKKLLAAEPPTR